MEEKVKVTIQYIEPKTGSSGTFEIEIYKTDEEFQEAFIEFFGKFLNSDNRSSFLELENPVMCNLKKAIHDYLTRTYLIPQNEKFPQHDFLFNNLSMVSNFLLVRHLIFDAQKFIEWILEITLEWEASNGNYRIHKGSLYFFWSRYAIINNEIDKGFFIIHKAYEEDCITQNTDTPDTPAYKTVTLNKDERNLLFTYVSKLWGFLDMFIDSYNKENTKSLSQSSFESKFLLTPPSKDLLFTFTHTLARIHQMFGIRTIITNSEFAGLFMLNLLFNLVLIIDNYLYARSSNQQNNNNSKFFELAKNLLINSGIETNIDNCKRNLSNMNSETLDFDNKISMLLDRTYNFPAPIQKAPLYYDVCICYCIRNHSAHNLSLSKTIAIRFHDICRSILNVLFLSIEVYGD